MTVRRGCLNRLVGYWAPSKQEYFWEDAEMSDLDLSVRSLTWGLLHKAAIQPAWLLRVLPEIFLPGGPTGPR